MRVIGTAGHVDHGKSTLVEALTGIDPDRLQEEQERQMTIDLGFAWMSLPSGEEVGIVDVPGHRDFIENMLAGIGGIDAALLVVAADEGVMPQTREHLAILDLLEIDRAVIALTKVDLISDDEWTELVEADVISLLEPTQLAGAPIVPVSSKTGHGLQDLRSALDQQLDDLPQRLDRGKPRLPIDRVFSIVGFGTVVTGTLSDGKLGLGEEVELLPTRTRGRIRGLQTHKQELETAVPGSRVAVNLSGLNKADINRGEVLVRPGTYQSTRLLDVYFRLLAEAQVPIKHDHEAKVFIGAAQRMARIRLLGGEEIRPGEEGWLQLVLEADVLADKGDFFILRRPSPAETLGGGRIADPHPKGFHKRKDEQVIDALEKKLLGSPEEVISESLRTAGFSDRREIYQRTGLESDVFESNLVGMLQRGEIHRMVLPGGTGEEIEFLVHKEYLNLNSRDALGELESYHQGNPLRSGMPKEELKSRLDMESNAFLMLLQSLEDSGEISATGSSLCISGFEVRLSSEDSQKVENLMCLFEAQPYSPPTYKECVERVGENLVNHLQESGKLKKVSAEILFESSTYKEMVEKIEKHIKKSGTISVAEVRDLFGTSRKYALPLMEYLDSIGLTTRQGDVRKLKISKKTGL